MYLLVIMHVLPPVRKSKIFFICTVLNLTPVNHITNTKPMLNAVLGISEMSLIAFSPSLVPLIIYRYSAKCMSCTSSLSPTSTVLAIFPLTSIYMAITQYFSHLCFQFYETVYHSGTDSFPSPVEKKGRWVGFAPMSGILSLSAFLQMTLIKLSVTLLYALPLYC